MNVARDGVTARTPRRHPVTLVAALLVTVVFHADARAMVAGAEAARRADDARRADERALFGWAVHLSRYPSDALVPEVRYEPHRLFVERARPGRSDCRVLGRYDGRDVIHVDEALGGLDPLFARSLLVHEFVHALQHRSGEFGTHGRARLVAREREAQAIQRAYLVAHGAPPAARARHHGCAATAGAALAESGARTESTEGRPR